MANEALYPGAPDFRNPAQGNSNAPNIRSALFTLPIVRAGIAQQNLPGGDQHIPWVTRFNNFGNSALDTDGNGANGFEFVQNASDPTQGQLPSRGDFRAQILHYRLRGANSVNLFEAGAGSVQGYGRELARDDVRFGFREGVAVNQIFGRGNFGLANLGSNILIPGDVSRTAEQEGMIWSGVFDRAVSSGNRVLAIAMSNLSNAGKYMDLPNSIGDNPATTSVNEGRMVVGGDNGRSDDFFLPAGTHRYLTFELRNNRWELTSSRFLFTESVFTNRNGVGIPEPATAGLLGCGLVGLLARRRRTA